MAVVLLGPDNLGESRTYQKLADKAIRHFRRDLKALYGLSGVRITYLPGSKEEGRYSFKLTKGPSKNEERSTIIDMPGVPIDRVRWFKQNPWHFPRLYVDGASWLWAFALARATEELTGEEYETRGIKQHPNIGLVIKMVDKDGNVESTTAV